VPVLLAAPIALVELLVIRHGALAALLLLVATALAAPLTLLARSRFSPVCAVLSTVMLGWPAAVVVLFVVHPPE
jgi:hypothetical protein